MARADRRRLIQAGKARLHRLPTCISGPPPSAYLLDVGRERFKGGRRAAQISGTVVLIKGLCLTGFTVAGTLTVCRPSVSPLGVDSPVSCPRMRGGVEANRLTELDGLAVSLSVASLANGSSQGGTVVQRTTATRERAVVNKAPAERTD